MGWVVNAPAELLPGKTLYPLNRRLGGPQGRSERVWKFSPSLGFDLRNVQPVTSFYTGSIKGAVWNSKYCETLSFESWKFPNQWESGFWRLWIYILIYCTTLSDGTAVGVGQRLPFFFRNNFVSRNTQDTFGKSNRRVPSDHRIFRARRIGRDLGKAIVKY